MCVCVHPNVLYEDKCVFSSGQNCFVCVSAHTHNFFIKTMCFVCVCVGGGGVAGWVRVCAHARRFSMKTDGFYVCVRVFVCVSACVYPQVFLKTSAYYLKTNFFFVCVRAHTQF